MRLGLILLAAGLFLGGAGWVPMEKSMPRTVHFPEMIKVEGGTFSMGEKTDWGEEDERPVREVTVSTFEISKYEVGQYFFQAFLRDQKGSKEDIENLEMIPAVGVTWEQAIEFCNFLSLEGGWEPVYFPLKGDWNADWKANGYRLPTEAEWEFAARGGNLSQDCLYAGSDDPGEVGWFTSNSGKEVHQVGEKAPNELGIYDMSGNVWEWCWDAYDPTYYASAPVKNPTGPNDPFLLYHVKRGGSAESLADYLRNANRHQALSENAGFTGIRLVRSLPRK